MTRLERQASDITRAHSGVPRGLNFAGFFISGDAVVFTIMDQDEGVTHATHRAVQIVDHCVPVGNTTPVVIIESGIDVREIHRLRINEFRTLDGAFGSDRRAREQQPGKRACFAHVVVLVVHESDIFHFVVEIVILVAADREIGGCGWQAAAVSDLGLRPGIADVVGFPHEQRVDDP